MKPDSTPDRRTVLKGLGLGALSTAGPIVVGDRAAAAPTQARSIISINSPSDIELGYRLNVSGNLEKSSHVPPGLPHDAATTDPGDMIDESSAYGTTQGGVDSYAYTGEVTIFETTNCEAANVWVDDARVDACRFPQPDETGDGSRTDPAQIISINSPSDVQVAYEFAASRSLEKSSYVPPGLPHDAATTDPNDQIADGIARGTTQGGVDSYRFTGTIDAFTATNCASANVWIDDRSVDACQFTSSGSQASECQLGVFRRYSTAPPSGFDQLREYYKEKAERAETYYKLSKANALALEGFQTIVQLSYGNREGTVDEFLDDLVAVTRAISEDNSHSFYDTLYGYAKGAQSAYNIATSDTSTMEEYIELVSEARDLRQEQDTDSMVAALKLASRGVSGQLKNDALNIAVEISELPTDNAISALNINAQQQLAFKVYAESQLPVFDELARIARRRELGKASEEEMYAFFIHQQERWSSFTHFANQIHQLDEIGRNQSLFFWFAREFGELIGQGDLKEDAKTAMETGQRRYNNHSKKLVDFRNAVQECP